MKDKPAVLSGKPLFEEEVGIVMPSISRYSNGKLIREIERIFKSNIVTNGKTVERLESELCEYLKVKHVVAISSCTVALALTIQSMGLEDKEVLIPPFTFVATANACRWNRCKIKFVDIDRETFNISVQDIEAKISRKTKAIIGVHIFGNPCEISKIQELGEKYGILVMFDAAQALGSVYHGKRIGGFGAVEVFSGSPTKHFTSMEGGFVATNNSQLAEKISLARNCGILPDYNCVVPGLNGRMTEINAAVGLSMVTEIDTFIKNRNLFIDRYKSGLREIRGLSFQKITKMAHSSYNYFGVVIEPEEFGLTNRQLYEALKAEGIMTKIYYHPPIHKQYVYREYSTVKLPNAEFLCDHIICLPLYNFMEDSLIDKICYAVDRIHRNADAIKKGMSET